MDNTLCLTEYLLGRDRTGGAHGRYAKRGELTFLQTQKAILDSVTTPARQLSTFTAVCNNFPPVLHHFFLENFRDPWSWFDKRIRFTRSVAVSSIAGYIIGLGDRHFGNILIDSQTAEVVHIDFGVAFEQGKTLRTPELVPFRLTRDLVDGMGITGVEGPMRRSCEECLSVLRSNQESILTCVGVLINDPLYQWAMTPIKADKRQHEEDDQAISIPAAGAGDRGGGSLQQTAPLFAPPPIHSTKHGSKGAQQNQGPASAARAGPASINAVTVTVSAERDPSGGLKGQEGGVPGKTSSSLSVGNADAERAVMRVRQKLEGLDQGQGGVKTIAGQVALLLAEAQDHEKLCRMYVGWSSQV